MSGTHVFPLPFAGLPDVLLHVDRFVLLARPRPQPSGYRPHVTRSTLALLVAAFALFSCTPGGGQQPGPSASQTAASSGNALPNALATPGARAAIPDEQLLRPLTQLGPCKPPPPAAEDDDVAGLVVPDGAVVISQTRADPLVNVQGYVEMTPIQMRVFYQQNRGVEVLSVEDEIQESEVLLEADGYRLFVKTQAVCELGSLFVAIVAPQE